MRQILAHEGQLVRELLDRLSAIRRVWILAADQRKRLGVVSFIIKGTHYSLVVKMLNDRYGIQARGGCSCAGTYGHFLLGIDRERSKRIRHTLMAGELRSKPGWIRLSLHPTMTADEFGYIADAVQAIAMKYGEWKKAMYRSEAGG